MAARCVTTPTSCAHTGRSRRCGASTSSRRPDRAHGPAGGAAAARALGMNRLAERLEPRTRRRLAALRCPAMEEIAARHLALDRLPRGDQVSRQLVLRGARRRVDRPDAPSETGLEWFADARAERILLTNRHHYRHSDGFRERFGCPVLCHEAGLHEFEGGPEVEGFSLRGRGCRGIVAREVGAICPEETALHISARRRRDRRLPMRSSTGRRRAWDSCPTSIWETTRRAVKRGLAASLRRLLDARLRGSCSATEIPSRRRQGALASSCLGRDRRGNRRSGETRDPARPRRLRPCLGPAVVPEPTPPPIPEPTPPPIPEPTPPAIPEPTPRRDRPVHAAPARRPRPTRSPLARAAGPGAADAAPDPGPPLRSRLLDLDSGRSPGVAERVVGVPVEHRPLAERAAARGARAVPPRPWPCRRGRAPAPPARPRAPARALPSAVRCPYPSPSQAASASRSRGVDLTGGGRLAPRLRSRSRVRRASRATTGAPTGVRSFTTTPVTRVRSPASRRPAARPAAVPARAERHHHMGRLGQLARAHLLRQLERGLDEPEASERRGSAHGRKYGRRRRRRSAWRSMIQGAAA